jgi:diguanylate cyclase (GGDEF)-like protein
VLLAEIDGLDAVTGALGRRRADALLTEVADLLTDRHPHRVYRLGGEVFAVVLPRISAEDAFLLADALRSDVADRLPPLSMTIGVAGLDERCTDAETLLIAADAALDEARALGGNRVVGPGDATFGLRWVANRPGN